MKRNFSSPIFGTVQIYHIATALPFFKLTTSSIYCGALYFGRKTVLVVKLMVPQESVLGPLLFLMCVNDLPQTLNDKTVPILFADDTTIIVKSPNSKDFQTNMVTVFNCVNKWFKVNLLSINGDKTRYIQFKTKHKPTLHINIVYQVELPY